MVKVVHILALGEILSLAAMVIIFFKIFLLSTDCFSLGDGYFTILPLFITKIVEIWALFSRNRKE
jgi:hypothetical protein